MSMDKLSAFVNRMIRPIKVRLYNMISRVVIESINDADGIQVVKLSALAGEERTDVERFQDYGFTSNPLPGSEGIVICPQGNRDHMIVIKIDSREFRLKGLANGEVAMYTDEGDKIHFKRGGIIDIDTKTLELGRGTLEKILNGETFQAFFNIHPHLGNLGAPTGPPITPSGSTHLSTVVKAAK